MEQIVFLCVNAAILLLTIGFLVTTVRLRVLNGPSPADQKAPPNKEQESKLTVVLPKSAAPEAQSVGRRPEAPSSQPSTADVLRLLDSGAKCGSRGSAPPASLQALKRSPEQTPGLEPSWSSQEVHGSALTASQASLADPAGPDAGVSALRNLPEVLRARTMEAQLGSLEMGALLGRGSFGKVFKAKWRGTMVAIKVIEHGSSQSSKLDGLRESALSSAFQHPNVLVTYKVVTQTLHASPTASHSPRDSAYDHAGRNPAHPGPEAGKAKQLKHAHSEPPMANWPGSPLGSAQGPSMGLPTELRTHKERVGAWEDAQETWLLMEYCDRGNLSGAIARGRFHLHGDPTQPNMIAIYRTLIDISAGMDFLHSVGVLHGDLKACNVLLKSTSRSDDPRGFTCKVSDFGLSQLLEAGAAHMTTQTFGTVAYMPLELLKDGRLSPAVDVYSFGCIMFEIFTRERMFGKQSAQQIFSRVLCGRRQPLPEGLPAGYKDLLQACWDVDPTSRPPFSAVTAWLRRLYYGLNGGERDSRQSLELNPWDTGDRASHSFRRQGPSRGSAGAQGTPTGAET